MSTKHGLICYWKYSSTDAVSSRLYDDKLKSAANYWTCLNNETVFSGKQQIWSWKNTANKTEEAVETLNQPEKQTSKLHENSAELAVSTSCLLSLDHFETEDNVKTWCFSGSSAREEGLF